MKLTGKLRRRNKTLHAKNWEPERNYIAATTRWASMLL
jgi:hypothetical protein